MVPYLKLRVVSQSFFWTPRKTYLNLLLLLLLFLSLSSRAHMYRHKYDIERRKEALLFDAVVLFRRRRRSRLTSSHKKRERERACGRQKGRGGRGRRFVDFWWVVVENHHHHHHHHHHDDDDDGRRCCRVRDGARRASDRPSRVPPPPRRLRPGYREDDPVLDGVSPRAPTRDALSSRVETHTQQAFFFLLCFWGTQRRRRLENGDGIDWWNDDVVDDVRHVDVVRAFTWRCRACFCSKRARHMGKGKASASSRFCGRSDIWCGYITTPIAEASGNEGTSTSPAC